MESSVIELGRAAEPLLGHLPAKAWIPWYPGIKPNGKMDKKPALGTTSDEPANWRTLPEALGDLCLTELPQQYAYQKYIAGIGFIVTAGVITFDIDDCRDPKTGELADDAQAELERCNSYAYVTPSGTGIRIVGTNSAEYPIPGQKKHLKLPSGRKIEVFIGPTNHFNTFTSAVIDGYTTLCDISDIALDMMAGLQDASTPRPDLIADEDAVVSIGDVRAALDLLPNPDMPWDDWNTVGMTTWRVTGGSADGFQLFDDWSAKSPKYEGKHTLERWNHYRVSPPTQVTFGKLVWLVRNTPGGDPAFREPQPIGLFRERPDLDWEGLTRTRAPATEVGDDIFATLDIAALCAMPPVEWLLDGILTADGFCIVYGPPGSLKSFLVLAWALHVASGTPWLGKPVRQCGVLYVAGEGVRGTGRRIRAWQAHNQMTDVDLPFRLLPSTVNLTDAAQVSKLVRTAKAVAALEGCPIGLVVIDTVARAIPGADENSAQDMGRFVAAVDAIKQDNGGAVLGVHHSGKDVERGARGSSAMLGAVDTMVAVRRDEERLKVSVEKQKDDDEGPPIRLRTKVIDLLRGLTAETSLVLENDDGSDRHQPEPDTLAAYGELLGKIASVLGPNGRMTTRKVAEAVGLSSGRGLADIATAIPLSPDYVEISMPNGSVRLGRTRVSDASNSPIEVVRYDV